MKQWAWATCAVLGSVPDTTIEKWSGMHGILEVVGLLSGLVHKCQALIPFLMLPESIWMNKQGLEVETPVGAVLSLACGDGP